MLSMPVARGRLPNRAPGAHLVGRDAGDRGQLEDRALVAGRALGHVGEVVGRVVRRLPLGQGREDAGLQGDDARRAHDDDHAQGRHTPAVRGEDRERHEHRDPTTPAACTRYSPGCTAQAR